MKRSIRTLITVTALAVLAPMTWLATPAQAGPDRVQAASAAAVDGTLGAPARRAIRQGYLVPDQAAYDASKRAALASRPPAEASTLDIAAGPAPNVPVLSRNWEGVRDDQVAPSDSTGAIGSTRYVELVNRRFGIYNRTSNAPVGTGTLQQLVGASPTSNVFDPQVIWDSQTNRFFYVADQVNSATANFIAWGFSKTDSPTTAADFCKYTVPFGSTLPDYPKLGDTADFLLVGTNNFNAAFSFLGAFTQWITKPAAGTACPAASSFTTGAVGPLKDANGDLTETPVPANQTDASSTGYIMTRANQDVGPDTFLTVRTVTKLPNGTASIPLVGTAITVPSYSIPAAAPQPGITQRLDTLDGRLTQAVSAIDPARGGAVGLWTQHTVTGGAGSQVRWYEINPAAATVFQRGTLTNNAVWVLNGAISPDRAVLGASAQFGSNMVVQVSTTSTATTPAMRVLSKRAGSPLTGPVTVVTSPAAYKDFTCPFANSTCRWGDYAAATPDPVADAGATVGRVWITNQYASGVQTTTQANWLSRNAAVTP